MDETTIDRQRLAMEKYGLDALVAFSMENVAYGAGYVVPSQALRVRNRTFAVVASRNGSVSMLLTENEVAEARVRSGIEDLRGYHEFLEEPMALLASLLRELGSGLRIGLEFDGLTADRWELLKAASPNQQFVAGTPAFEFARSRKVAAEVEALTRACMIADEAQADAHGKIRIGMTERDVARLIIDAALARGADRVAMIQVGAGERSVLSNPSPSDRPLRRGDVVKVDTFVEVNGYLSDTGRSFAVGEASEGHAQVWRSMQEVLARIHEEIRPGVVAGDVWDTFVKEFGERGMKPCIGFLGHGLGLSLHEVPYIAPGSEDVIEEGMTLAVEPVFERGAQGYHLEDNLLVGPGGVKNLTPHFGPELVVVDASPEW